MLNEKQRLELKKISVPVILAIQQYRLFDDTKQVHALAEILLEAGKKLKKF